MAKITVDVRDEETTLQSLLAQVREGLEIILADGNQPLARLSPLPPHDTGQRGVAHQPDLHPAAILTSDNVDDPLPDDFWPGESA